MELCSAKHVVLCWYTAVRAPGLYCGFHCFEERCIGFMLPVRRSSVSSSATCLCTRALRLRVCATVVLLLMPAYGATAQAFTYPSQQLPTASIRDYTAAIASGGGTSGRAGFLGRMNDPSAKCSMHCFAFGSSFATRRLRRSGKKSRVRA